MDQGSSWSASNPLLSSTNSSVERWESSLASGALNFPSEVTVSYFHQLLISNPNNLELNYVEYATSASTTANFIWSDAGKVLIVNAGAGSFAHVWNVTSQEDIYEIPNGIQLIVNTSATAINWNARTDVLSFNATKASIEAYVDPSLSLSLQEITDDGKPVVNYASSHNVISFNGSSVFQMQFSGSVSTTSTNTLPNSNVTTTANQTIQGGNVVSLDLPEIFLLPGTSGNETLAIYNQEQAYATLNSLQYQISNFTFSTSGSFLPMTVVPEGVGHILIIVTASASAVPGKYDVTGYADFQQFKQPVQFTVVIQILGTSRNQKTNDTAQPSLLDGMLVLVFAFGIFGIVVYRARKGASFSPS